jgi:hypothetical protein
MRISAGLHWPPHGECFVDGGHNPASIVHRGATWVVLN